MWFYIIFILRSNIFIIKNSLTEGKIVLKLFNYLLVFNQKNVQNEEKNNQTAAFLAYFNPGGQPMWHPPTKCKCKW